MHYKMSWKKGEGCLIQGYDVPRVHGEHLEGYLPKCWMAYFTLGGGSSQTEDVM